MNKELTPLKALERIKNAPTIYVGCASDIYTRYSHECKLIEKSIDELDEYKRAIKIIKNKLMYEVEPFDFMGYDTYEDYYQNYFEQRYEDENDYPDWWLAKEEFELLKNVFGKKYQNL